MEEIKSQLQYIEDLLDEDFRFTKTEIDGKTIYVIFNEENIPNADIRIYLKR